MVTGSTAISQLPTGTIDSLLAVLPLSIGMPSSPSTIRSSLETLRDYLLPPEYIDGLNISYVTSGSISVSPGTAYISSLNKAIHVTGSITAAVANAGANVSGTWSHVYLRENAGAAAVEISTGTPSTPYAGVARTKTGDTSRRWIGSVFHDAGGYLFRFASNIYGNVFRMNWIVVDNGSFFEYTGISGSTVTRDISHLIPLAGATNEIHIRPIFILGAGGDMLGAVGETVLFGGNTTPEQYLRQTTATAANLSLPASPIKISGSTIQAMTSHFAGGGSMSLRVRGISIQR